MYTIQIEGRRSYLPVNDLACLRSGLNDAALLCSTASRYITVSKLYSVQLIVRTHLTRDSDPSPSVQCPNDHGAMTDDHVTQGQNVLMLAGGRVSVEGESSDGWQVNVENHESRSRRHLVRQRARDPIDTISLVCRRPP